MAELDPQIAKVLAKLAVKADVARARQAEAAAAARAKIAAVGRGLPDVDTGVELDVPEPKELTSYDFESKPAYENPNWPDKIKEAGKENQFIDEVEAAERAADESPSSLRAKAKPFQQREIPRGETRPILEGDHGFPSEADVHPSGAHSGPVAQGSPAHVDAAQMVKRQQAAAAKEEAMAAAEKAGLPPAPEDLSPGQRAANKFFDRQRIQDVNDMPTEGALKAKATSRAHPAPEMAPEPAKPLAQEIAEVKPELPMKPLEGQGSMEGKPVESIIDRRGANMGRIAGDRRAAQPVTPKTTPAPEKVMTPEGAVEPVGKPAVGAGKMTAADLFGEAEARVVPKMTAGDLFPKPASLSEKFGKAVGRTSKFVADHPKTAGSLVKVVTEPLKELASPLEGFGEAGVLGKGWKLAKVGGQGVKMGLRDAVLPYVLEKVAEGGFGSAAENLGATSRGVEMPGQGTTFGTEEAGFSSLLDASNDAKVNLANLNAGANKYGLKVTGRTGMGSIYGLPLVNRFIQPGADIQVQEDPDLKAAYQARNKQRIQEMMENWATNPDKQ